MLFQLAGTAFHTTGKESIVSPYKKEHHRLKRCRLRKINMLDEPKDISTWNPFVLIFPPKEGQTSNQNKGPHLGYYGILFIKVFLHPTCIFNKLESLKLPQHSRARQRRRLGAVPVAVKVKSRGLQKVIFPIGSMYLWYIYPQFGWFLWHM